MNNSENKKSGFQPAASKPGMPNRLSRRTLLQSLPLLSMAPAALAQGPTPVAVSKIHSFDIRVSDVERSVKFYQDLFGAPIQARQGDRVCLRVGDGPRYFSISPLAPGEEPGFSYIGLSVADFDLEHVRDALASHGIAPTAPPSANETGLALASRSWVINRDNTPELYFADEEALVYHLSSETNCGGGGPLGDQCQRLEPAPAAGFLQLRDYSHFTNFVGGRERANNFYTTAFGKSYQAYQGPNSPVIGVGDGIQFLMYTGGSSAEPPTDPALIHHVCFTVADFDVDRILAQLTEYGLSARAEPSDTGPLLHWISMRMPNRGGAEGGTPELYFSDPDGIRIQLQDTGYCGGTGYLGDSCPPLA